MNTTSIHKIKGWNKYLDPKETNIRNLYNKYKSSAKKRKLVFNLSLEMFSSMIFKNCTYCGREPSKIHNRYLDSKGNRTHCAKKSNVHESRVIEGQIKFNGIDRIHNDLGYHSSNVTTCCYTCNQAKHDLSHDDFINWLDSIIKYRTTL